jgi:hypothetical protein
MDYCSSYPTKLDKSSLKPTEWVKLRTLELYSFLPQTTLEERDSFREIRDEIIALNDNFFWYIARSKYINNQTVSLEDRYQSAICHFMNNYLWAKYMFTPETGKKYRTDLAFSSFFKPRITECMEREFDNVSWTLRRSLCMKAGEQLGKYWSNVTYEDIAKVKLPPDQMEALRSIFCTMNNADINDVSIYKPAATVVEDKIEELYNDEYDSVEDLLIHEMLEKESKLEDSFLLKMSELYDIPFNELLKARPAAEEKLKAQLEEAINIQDVFNYNGEFYTDGYEE